MEEEDYSRISKIFFYSTFCDSLLKIENEKEIILDILFHSEGFVKYSNTVKYREDGVDERIIIKTLINDGFISESNLVIGESTVHEITDKGVKFLDTKIDLFN